MEGATLWLMILHGRVGDLDLGVRSLLLAGLRRGGVLVISVSGVSVFMGDGEPMGGRVGEKEVRNLRVGMA